MVSQDSALSGQPPHASGWYSTFGPPPLPCPHTVDRRLRSSKGFLAEQITRGRCVASGLQREQVAQVPVDLCEVALLEAEQTEVTGDAVQHA